MRKAAHVSLQKLGSVEEEELVGESGHSLQAIGVLLVAASLEHKGPRSGQRSGNIYHLFQVFHEQKHNQAVEENWECSRWGGERKGLAG